MEVAHERRLVTANGSGHFAIGGGDYLCAAGRRPAAAHDD